MKEKKQEDFAFLQEIKNRMDKLGWNAARLSHESGVNEATNSRAINSRKNISGDNLYKILTALGVLSLSLPLPEDKKSHRQPSQGNDMLLSLIAGREERHQRYIQKDG